MAVAELRKLGIIGLQSEQTAVLGALHEFGKFQIIRQGENDIDESVSQHEYALAQLKFTLDFIHRYKAEEKLSFREKMHRALTKGLRVNKQEVERIVREFDYKKVVQRAEKLESNINLAQSHVHNLEGEIAELEPWRNLRGAPRQDSQSVTIRFGVVSKERYELLSAAVQSQNLAAEVVPVDQSDKEVRAMIVYHAEAKKAVEPLLVEASFSDVVLPEISSPPAEAIELKRKEIETIHNQISAWKEEAEALSKDQPSLQILFDHTSWMKVRAEASLQGLRNQKTFSISGWVPEQRLGQLRGKLESVTENVATSELAIEEGEEPPVLLENNAVVSPFETVTNIYGAPKSTELDPTPYLAPFFILFFAICLSDAGYGLLLAGLSYGAIKLFKLPKENQGFFRLFVYAGIMTFVVGVLFGGWFGLVLEDLPENAITSLLLSLKVIDPVTSPLTMLVISLALGVVQIIVGITVNLYYQLKRKNLGRAFDAGAWLFFMFGVVFWLLAGQVFKQEGLQAVGLYWIYAALAVLVLTQGRRQKNIFMKLPSGILSLYSLVGYFSDVMSYSRLLALGLSTGIIAMVVNMVALLFRDMIPFVGWPVAVAILIGGHAFNLAINTLGSFIHSGRLQYVEFFPKFMEGGGSRFKPFAREAAYIHLPSYEAETIEPRSD